MTGNGKKEKRRKIQYIHQDLLVILYIFGAWIDEYIHHQLVALLYIFYVLEIEYNIYYVLVSE